MNRAAQNKARPTLGERGGVRASDQSKYQVSCSHLNQSLMELGALICTPRNPKCDDCPVRQLCVACYRGWQKKLPNLGKRAESTARYFVAFVVERNGKVLVHQRPAGVVNAHLWEFPNVEAGTWLSQPQRVRNLELLKNSSAPPLTEALRLGQPRSETIRKLGFTFATAKPLCIIKHSITRYRITLEAYRAEPPSRKSALQGKWLTLPQLHKLAFTSAHKRILAHLRGLH